MAGFAKKSTKRMVAATQHDNESSSLEIESGILVCLGKEEGTMSFLFCAPGLLSWGPYWDVFAAIFLGLARERETD